jgi:hypothetical protein
VSHWEVDDKVTAALMSKIFLLMQKNPKLRTAKLFSRRFWRSSTMLYQTKT